MVGTRKTQERYSVQDYLSWDDEQRWELIDGVVWDMTPAPSFKHQRVVGNVYRLLANALHGKSCVPGLAPTDVVLSEHDVVQPDVFVVCDPTKITDQKIMGAPELVVEVLSPGTSLKDRREKKQLYERSGVQEYLLLEPEGLYVERFVRQEDGNFDGGELFGSNETIVLHTLQDVELILAEIFGVSVEE